ncbi:Putative disease resistance protein At3g14460 [Linum grandiflorum]
MVSLYNLTRLSFRGCKEVKHLPPLGGLPSLEEVLFGGMGKVKKVGAELLGHDHEQHQVAFPRLSLLTFIGMPEWEEWDDDTMMFSSATVMPQLSCLILRNCDKLKKLPDALLQKPTLPRLEVNECPGIVLSEVWGKISHIPTIIFDYVDVRTGSPTDTFYF